MEATVSEIHAYPLRPEGFAEPLFHSHKSRQQILDHLARSRWLGRASEIPQDRRRHEPTPHEEKAVQPGRVLASWREVDRWWEEGGGVDRICYLVRTGSGGEEFRTRPSRVA